MQRIISNLIRLNLWLILLFAHHQSFRHLIAFHRMSTAASIAEGNFIGEYTKIWSKTIGQDCERAPKKIRFDNKNRKK